MGFVSFFSGCGNNLGPNIEQKVGISGIWESFSFQNFHDRPSEFGKKIGNPQNDPSNFYSQPKARAGGAGAPAGNHGAIHFISGNGEKVFALFVIVM